MTSLQLAIVEWDDAWTSEEPVSRSMAATVHKPELVTTIGWVLLDDERGITLANEYYDDTYRGRTFVPRAMIRSVTPYKLSKPRRKKADPPPTPA